MSKFFDKEQIYGFYAPGTELFKNAEYQDSLKKSAIF